MARRGRFGRRPRSSPDLTATIVSMAREYQNKMDQNVLNSWDKGGKVDGKQVTDEYLLNYLTDRRNGLSKDDPLYAEADQRLDEYTFAVTNSKQELGYAQHKYTDGQMSQFYTKWAGKLPQNSEAWRKLMMLAAQYKDRSKTGSGGGGGGRKSGYNSAANRVPGKKELAYDTMYDALNYVAHREGILNTEKETLGDLRVAENDSTRLMQLIHILSTDPGYAGYRKSLTDYIKKNGNPNFGGAFTWDTFQAEWVNKRAGLTARLRLAQKGGHATDAKALMKELTDGATGFTQLTAAKPLERYENARHIYDTATDDPNANPLSDWMAVTQYHNALADILKDVQAGADTSGDIGLATTAGHLQNEVDSLEGKGDVNAPTLWEDSRGTVAAYHQDGGEAANNVRNYAKLMDEVQSLVDGTGVMMRVDSKGQPTNDPEGVLKVVPTASVPADVAWAPTGGGLAVKSINFNGQDIDVTGVMTAIMPTPVYTEATSGLDFTGRPTSSSATPSSNRNIANMYVMPDGTKLAQYWDSAGQKRWTNDPDGLFVGPNGPQKPVDTPDGLVVTIATTPNQQKYNPNAVIDPGFTNPAQANLMVNKVGLSSFSVWMNSSRTATSDPGVAYAMDPRVMADAISRELGPNSPSLPAALREAEQARTDYLTNTSDIDRRIRAAAELNATGTLADKAGIEGYKDVTGLQRDVVDFYARLNAAQKNQGDPHAFARTSGSFEAGQNTDRDKALRAALMADPREAARIGAIEHAGFDPGMQYKNMEMIGQQQKKGIVAPLVQYDPNAISQADVVKGFKDLAAAQLGGGVKGALMNIGHPTAPAPPPGQAPGYANPVPPKPPGTAPKPPPPPKPPGPPPTNQPPVQGKYYEPPPPPAPPPIGARDDYWRRQ